MHTLYLFLALTLSVSLRAQSDSLYTQAYLEKSSRFAWLTYGGDLNYLTGGRTTWLEEDITQDVEFSGMLTPRLTVGGIHFWGHVDFYVTLPLSFLTLQRTPPQFTELTVAQGVETGLRLYPLKLQPGRVSPFVGASFRRIRFAQESPASYSSDNGVPSYGRFIYPIQFGATYTTKQWHFMASGCYNYQNEFNYYLSPNFIGDVRLHPVSYNLGVLRYLDLDRHLRTPRAAARVNRAYARLDEGRALDAWFVGLGPSSALQLEKSPYLRTQFPFFYDNYSVAILPDLSLGRYFHRPDMSVHLSYRTYGDRYTGFDAEIDIRRHSVGIESVKYLFNYLGFVPFAGLIVSHENLRATINGTAYKDDRLALGLTFGWDIRVTKTETSLLRTNLRYYPNLSLNIEGERHPFNHLEFNFIQYVYFFGRGKVLRG